jgi:hypothetical protein
LMVFTPKFFMHSWFPHACYKSCPSHLPWHNYYNYIWQKVQVMNLLIMQFSLTFYYFITLGSKYSPQQSVLRYLHCVFLY